ncbi:hypothetical protein GCM10023148_24980 [Actinokineospora soli]
MSGLMPTPAATAANVRLCFMSAPPRGRTVVSAGRGAGAGWETGKQWDACDPEVELWSRP